MTLTQKLSLICLALAALSACGVSPDFAVAPTNNIGNSEDDPDGAPGGFDPSGDYEKDCFWGPSTDPNAVNVLYPDKFAIYWTASFNIPAGGEVVLRGEYPLARYMSFNLYNPILQPIDAVADSEIVADEGSTNTSLANADRFADERSYTFRIIAAVPPENLADREPNTLYSFQGRNGQFAPSNQATVIYRVYIPDEGRDITGGVGLPTVAFKQANGTEITGSEGCEQAEQTEVPPTAADAIAESDPLQQGTGTGTFDPPQWLKFFNFQGSQANRFNATPAGNVIRPTPVNPQDAGGGFASNVHNAYIYASARQNPVTAKEILVFAAKMPNTPTTLKGDATMGDGDMRYWSICTNDRDSQRWVDCVYDEITVPMQGDDSEFPDGEAAGWRLFVVAPGANIPTNAIAENGVNFLAWGVAGDTLLIARHMLSENDFPEAIQFIPGAAGSCEAPVMQHGFPYIATMSVAEFESFGAGVSYADLDSYLKASQFSQEAANSNCKTDVDYDGDGNTPDYPEPTRPDSIEEADGLNIGL